MKKKKSINSRRGKSDKVELAKKLKKKRKRKGREGEKKGEINILEVWIVSAAEVFNLYRKNCRERTVNNTEVLVYISH